MLLGIASDAGADVTIDIYTTRSLPETLEGPTGKTLRPADSAQALEITSRALARQRDNVRLDEVDTATLSKADELGLTVLMRPEGAGAMVGAVLTREHEGEVIQEVVAFVGDPSDVPYQLGAALWRLGQHDAERMTVGFVCAAGSFCPRPSRVPVAPSGTAWPPAVQDAFDAVLAPFEGIRASAVEALKNIGIATYAMEPRGPVPAEVEAVVLANPSHALDGETVRWLDEVRLAGTPVLLLLPSARLRAARGDLVKLKTNDGALLDQLGLARTSPLLVDRGSLAEWVWPQSKQTRVKLPLVAQVADQHPSIGAVTGLTDLSLPLASSLRASPTSALTPVAWSRPGVVPCSLPAPASDEGLADKAPAGATGQPRELMHVLDEPGEARLVVIGSGLGLPDATAASMLRSLDLEAAEADLAGLVQRLTPYRRAAERYRATQEANADVRDAALKLMRRSLWWMSEPAQLRALVGTGKL